MTTVRLDYLWISRRRGKPAAYYRRDGASVRIRAADGSPVVPGDPRFLAAYGALHAAHAAAPKRTPDAPAAGSLAHLVGEYLASPQWSDLSANSRDEYGRALNELRDKFGKLPVAAIPPTFGPRLLDAYAKDAAGRPTPRRANRMVAVARLLFTWGIRRGHRPDGVNPAARSGRLRTGPGYAAWTDEAVARFLGHPEVSEPLKRAVALGWHTGQRKQDCIAMTKAARAGGVIDVTPRKTERSTGARLRIPEHPELTAVLDAAPASTAVTILTRDDGRPWKVDHFNHALAEAVKLAGLEGLSFHGLRKGMAVRLAEAGATDAEQDAVVYHAPGGGGLTRHYRRDARQKELAASAIGRLTGKGKS